MGIPGANTWKEEWADFFDAIPVIYVLVEPDSGGEAVLRWLARSKIRDRVKIVELESYKDPSELYIFDPANFTQNWQYAIEQAKPFPEINPESDQVTEQKALEACKIIALNPSILDLLVADLKRLGLVGEERNAKVLFLALISRFLNRPVSVSIKGPSSCGKSFLIEQVLKFFPENAFYRLTAMSERALAYSEEPLTNRFLVICEANGIEGDLLSYFLRSLLSEGMLRYETVENTANGLKPRLIEKEGPTGLIVTTTALSLHPENETRILSLPISDTKEQTHDVLMAIARNYSVEPDLAQWHALQLWLEKSEHRVFIPYGEILAKLVPPMHVRLRRDFGHILNLIKAHAILQQANRQRTEKEEIIATIDDYQVIRSLVVDIIGEGIGMVVSESIRQTVNCVKMLIQLGQSEVKEKEIAVKLNLDKSVIHRRVQKAISMGFLVNNETQKYHHARLILGEVLPENVEFLPSAESLSGCMVAFKTEGGDTPPPPQEIIQEFNSRTFPERELEAYPWTMHLKE